MGSGACLLLTAPPISRKPLVDSRPKAAPVTLRTRHDRRMPRPNPSGTSERKRRSRKGCWRCKARKIKCGEQHPACSNCLKRGEVCDYSIRLNWDGHHTKRSSPYPTNVSRPSRPDQCSNTLANETPQSAGWPMQPSSEQASREADSPEPSRVAKKRRWTCDELTFVDRTPRHAGFFAERCLDALQGAATIGSPHHAAQSTSPALHARDKTTKSLTEVKFELNELDLGEARSSSSPFMAHMPASPALFDSPLTPAASSYSDDILYRPHWLDSQTLGSPDSRLSVSSDFADSHDLSYRYSLPGSSLGADGGQRFHGYDLGKQDEDLTSNDDASAISIVTPAGCEPFSWVINSGDVARAAQGHTTSGQEGGYYDKAVSILIPWELEPLPEKLRNNKMNLLYFHHFIDHTAKVLVPYHEQESNPMSKTLPRMALYSDGLMSLLLAYSAAHRARSMQSNVPGMRMAQWAQDVFPALREALAGDQQPVSNVTLTMSIMLASLEIVSPGALGHGISWRQHLKQAGELMARRLEDLNKGRFDHQRDKECLFIRSWLAYLNMLGTLSPAPRDDTAIRIHPLNIDALIKDMDEVDCIMGFSARCARLLNHVAGMAKLCDRERIGPDHHVLPGWVPRPKTIELALSLEQQLMESMKKSSKPCLHVRMGNIQMRDLAEMAATNEAFHWAGIVHLHRRVLGKDSSHPDVQGPVQQIVQCLEQTRIGGKAETGLLFPMFTAGCETADKSHRAKILVRIKSAETSGMAQVYQARRLMETVWERGGPWETMIKDEFIG